jgi:hypothetical protein
MIRNLIKRMLRSIVLEIIRDYEDEQLMGTVYEGRPKDWPEWKPSR